MNAQEARTILEGERGRGLRAIASAATREELDAAKTSVLGRKTRFAEAQRALGSFDHEDRRVVGMLANEVRDAVQAAFEERRVALEVADGSRLLEADGVDVTLPGRRPRPGSLHPLAIVERRIVDVFMRMGYQVVEGPEIEDDWHNFEALNIPPDHPARTMKDSLYVDIPGRLLRTETSAAQIRTMETQEPPIHIVCPGRVFRQETPDATHLPVFSQVECLAVDEGITFADLKGTLETFARAMFGGDRKVRMNPDYFPFVEPGAQVAVS
jgi:phenylalanyl-tRNA synthetase alpha chain